MTHIAPATTDEHDKRGGGHFLSALTISLTCGVLGVATGLSVFILLSEDPEATGLSFLLILTITALLSFFFEYLRSVIDDHEEEQSASKVVFTFIMLAFFELFVAATHRALSGGRAAMREIGTVVLGRVLAAQTSAEVNMMVMVGIWIVIGALLALTLVLSIYCPSWVQSELPAFCRPEKRRGGALGFLVGAFGAPLCVIAYVVVARIFVEISWMLSDPKGWSTYISALYPRIPWHPYLIPMKLVVGGISRVCSMIPGRGPTVTFLVLVVLVLWRARAASKKGDDDIFLIGAIFAAVAIYGLPIGETLWNDRRTLWHLILLVAVIWVFPSFILGIMVPYLNRRSADPRSWAYIAWIAGCVLLVFAWVLRNHWIVFSVSALILFLSGLLCFRRSIHAEGLWPLLTLSVATFIVGVTNLTLSADFLHVQDLSSSLISEPMAAVEVKSPKSLPIEGKSYTWGKNSPAILTFTPRQSLENPQDEINQLL
jgi:hypothetical protein